MRISTLAALKFVLASWLAVVATEVLAADAPCPRPARGPYTNYSYGFSLVIPDGMVGNWNSAVCAPDAESPGSCICMGDHGREIPLNDGGVISVHAFYANGSLQSDLYQDLRQFEGASDGARIEIGKLGTQLFHGLPAYRYIATKRLDQVVVVREAVLTHMRSGVAVLIYIEGPEPQYLLHRRAYTSILKSWRASRPNDSLEPARVGKSPLAAQLQR